MPAALLGLHRLRRTVADLQPDRGDVGRPEMEARAIGRDQGGAVGKLGHASLCWPMISTTAWLGTCTVSDSSPPGSRFGSLLSSARAQCRLLVGGSLNILSSTD